MRKCIFLGELSITYHNSWLNPVATLVRQLSCLVAKIPRWLFKGSGLNQLWYKDTASTAAEADNSGFAARHAYLIQSPTVKCTFSFRKPLKHIIGFCEDYVKIVYGFEYSLTLVRKTDGDAIFRGAAAGAGKVSLDKMSWFMPHVILTDADTFSIYKTIESKLSYQ